MWRGSHFTSACRDIVAAHNFRFSRMNTGDVKMKKLILVLALAATATTLAPQTPDPQPDDSTVLAQRFCPRGKC